nr:hypothetical protein [Tanacetum cinerariifolium]
MPSHDLTKGAIIQIFCHGLDEPTQEILDGTAEGIFLYKTLNQAFQFLKDKVPFKLDYSMKSQNKHHQKSVTFVDGSNTNNDNPRLKEKLEALTIKMDSQFTSTRYTSKVTTIEESKDLKSLSLDELIENLKVYEMIIKKDTKIVKEKVKKKYLALKAKKESSDEEYLTSKSKDEEYAMTICLGVVLEPNEWIKDNRCSNHVTGNQKLFTRYKAYNRGNVIFGSNLYGNIIGKGQICDTKCRVTSSEHDSEITKDGKIIADESWIVAMQEELNQFIANDVWELILKPRNITIIGTKWVFRNKLDENGIVSRNKARILLAYACALDFKLFQMDVKSALLNGLSMRSSTCQNMCDEFAKIMHDEFEMSMVDELNFFPGLQIKQMEDGIFFNQSKYIKEMLKKFVLEESKPMKTPMSSDTKHTKDEQCESKKTALAISTTEAEYESVRK